MLCLAYDAEHNLPAVVVPNRIEVTLPPIGLLTAKLMDWDIGDILSEDDEDEEEGGTLQRMISTAQEVGALLLVLVLLHILLLLARTNISFLTSLECYAKEEFYF